MHELTITGPCPARRMILNEGVHLIGRLPSSDIQLDGDGISREHARIEVHGAEAVVLDQGSMNGTLVGGEVVDRRRLEDGDAISVGRYRLLYRRSEGPADLTEVADAPEANQLVPVRPAAEAGRKSRPRDEAESAKEPREARAPRVSAQSSLSESAAAEGSRRRGPSEDAATTQPEVRRSRPEPRLGLGLATAEPHRSERSTPVAEPRRLRLNFKARLAAALLGIVLLAVVLIGLGVITAAEDDMAAEAQSRARTLVYLLAEMNAEKLHSGEAGLITEPLTGEVGVRRALILDETGHVVAPEALHGRSEPVLEAAAHSDDYLRQITPDGAILSAPIRSGGRRYGTAVLDFSVAYLKDKTGHMGVLALLLGTFIGGVALLCAAVLDRLAHRPFAVLASEIDLVLKGNLRGEVPMTTDKKANQLCEALNRLIQRAGERLRSGEEPRAPVEAARRGSLEALREMGEILPVGLLGVAEDGRLMLWNEAAVDLLGSDLPSGGSPHLLDAFSLSPHLGSLAALLRESRQSPDKPIAQRFGGGSAVEAQARTLALDGERLTLIALERIA
jgi:PAS domain-containing protein